MYTEYSRVSVCDNKVYNCWSWVYNFFDFVKAPWRNDNEITRNWENLLEKHDNLVTSFSLVFSFSTPDSITLVSAFHGGNSRYWWNCLSTATNGIKIGNSFPERCFFGRFGESGKRGLFLRTRIKRHHTVSWSLDIQHLRMRDQQERRRVHETSK